MNKKASVVKNNRNQEYQPKRLTKEQMRKLLLSAKEKADKMPEEQGSFRLEVICKKADIDKK